MRISAVRISILFLILGVLAMQIGTAALLGVIWDCRLRCTSDEKGVLTWAPDVECVELSRLVVTSDGVVLGPAWASDGVLVLVLVWASDVA